MLRYSVFVLVLSRDSTTINARPRTRGESRRTDGTMGFFFTTTRAESTTRRSVIVFFSSFFCTRTSRGGFPVRRATCAPCASRVHRVRRHPCAVYNTVSSGDIVLVFNLSRRSDMNLTRILDTRNGNQKGIFDFRNLKLNQYK